MKTKIYSTSILQYYFQWTTGPVHMKTKEWKKEGNMTQANVKIVGTKKNPISVFWNVSNKKTDEYLLILSICSGAYGAEFLDKESFIYSCNKFFKYAKKNNDYYTQFEYVLLNGNEECTLFLRDLIFKKWKIVFEYKREKIALA